MGAVGFKAQTVLPYGGGFKPHAACPPERFAASITGSYKNRNANKERKTTMSQNDRQYSEKRDFIRMHVKTDVQLLIGERQVAARCIDLSSTGMQVVLSEPLQVGQQVRVLIPSSHPELRGLDAETEVVRVADLADGQHRIGLAILRMN